MGGSGLTDSRLGASVRQRAHGLMQKTGNWPCTLASLGGGAFGRDDGPEGQEMRRRNSADGTAPGKPVPSPTSVVDLAAWHFSASSASTFLGEGGLDDKTHFTNMTNQRFGGGMFASMRGAHNSWQAATDADASSCRQKHALSLALQAKGRSGGSAHEDIEASSAREAPAERDAPGAAGTPEKESPMSKLIRGLNDGKHASSPLCKMLFTEGRTPPSTGGAFGVRASAFALASSNAVTAGRPPPHQHCEAPPRVPVKAASTREGVAGMSRACATKMGAQAQPALRARVVTGNAAF